MSIRKFEVEVVGNNANDYINSNRCQAPLFNMLKIKEL